MISIAMTTYNGEKYIIEQLDSIRLQTRKPEEVVIVDDCSTDSTVTVIKEYIARYRLGWRVYQNTNNLGWKKNFYKAISMTSGDIVFFCDQDDVWNSKKIQKMVRVMDERQDISVLACTVEFIDNDKNKISIPYTKIPYSSHGTNRLKKIKLDKRFTYSIMPGCTMAVKREVINKYIKYIDYSNDGFLPHDALFWKMGIIDGNACLLNESLIGYRIHTGNASSPQDALATHVKSKKTRSSEALKNKNEILQIIQICKEAKAKKNSELLNSIIDFCNWRVQYINHKAGFNIIGLIRRCGFYRSWRMLIGDICARYKGE